MKVTDVYLKMKEIIEIGKSENKSVSTVKFEIIDFINDLYRNKDFSDEEYYLFSGVYEYLDDIFMNKANIDEIFVQVLNDYEHEGHDLFGSKLNKPSLKLTSLSEKYRHSLPKVKTLGIDAYPGIYRNNGFSLRRGLTKTYWTIGK